MEQTAGAAALTTEEAQRVFAITLFTDDLAESARFYRDVFGMPVVNEDATSIAFAFPNIVVNLVTVDDAPQLIEPAPVGGPGTPAGMMLTLQVTDVDLACERLIAHGVTLLNGPMTRPWGPRTATFADPSGHCWELSN
ncbi:MAG TPA: VOC family protein [Candidatus Limnocylindria bacterium]|nr:VOC family protein [Candidatus Limnocylindria bacterium]